MDRASRPQIKISIFDQPEPVGAGPKPTPTPKEVGEQLGLELGLDGRAAPWLTNEQLFLDDKKLKAAILLCGSASWDWWQCFALLYLPCFLRTLCENPLRPNLQRHVVSCWYFQCAEPVLDSRAMARFVRAYPEMAADFYVSFVELVASIHPKVMRSYDADNRFNYFHIVLGSIIGFNETLNLHMPLDYHPPIFPTSTVAKLRSLRDIIRSSAGAETWKSFERFVVGCATGTFPTDRLPRVPECDGWYYVWWSCEEVRGDKKEHREGHADCVGRAGQSGQMDMCSRCNCVRYCSKAHQKADWKRHKLACLKPSW